MATKTSTAVKTYVYKPFAGRRDGILEVTFVKSPNVTYRYLGVELVTYEALKAAESTGNFVATQIVRKYQSQKIINE